MGWAGAGAGAGAGLQKADLGHTETFRALGSIVNSSKSFLNNYQEVR